VKKYSETSKKLNCKELQMPLDECLKVTLFKQDKNWNNFKMSYLIISRNSIPKGNRKNYLPNDLKQPEKLN
jgi:hypothetical protein